ncbi:calcium-binding protein, partial [Cribrihabitans sp. XS_ASV171]
TFQVQTGHNEAGEIYDGGSGSNSLSLFSNDPASVFDFTDDTLTGLDRLRLLALSSPPEGGGTVRLTEGQAEGFVEFEKFSGTAPVVIEVALDTETLGLDSALVTGFTGIDRFEITGDGSAEFIAAPNANTHVRAGTGADNIVGGTGDDTIEGGAGTDGMNGGGGVNTLSYASAGAGVTVTLDLGTITSGGDNGDIFDSFSNFQNFIGTEFDDVIRTAGVGPDNTVHALGGNDFIRGFDGDDSLDGGADNDTIEGDSGQDTILGGAGNDEIRVDSNTDPVNTDHIDGGDDTDRLTYFSFGPGTVDLRGATILSIEELDGSFGTGATTLQLVGSQFGAGIASDALFRGDTDAGADRTIEIFLDGPNSLSLFDVTFADWDLDDRIIIRGTGAGENIVGSSRDDSVEGGAGNDILHNTGGVDILRGGENNDNFQVGEGADGIGEVYDGGNGTDRINVFGNGGSLFDFRDDVLISIEDLRFMSNAAPFEGGGTVFLSSSQAAGFTLFERSGGTAEARVDITMDGTSLDLSSTSVIGFAPGDRFAITGTGIADTISGSHADDSVEAGDGDDTVEGGLGADSLDGGVGARDMVSYAGSAGPVQVSFASAYALEGDAAGDVLSGFEDLR